MNEIFIKFIIIYAIFNTIYITMEFKADNLINGKYQTLWFLLLLISIRIVFANDFDDYSYIPLLFLFAAAGFIVFQKNKLYLFKGIDRKLIKENKNEIKKIIDSYKDNYVDYKSEITVFKNRIVFKGVNKPQTEECLLLVGEFLNENRKDYTIMDYVIYIIKTWVLPVAIILLATFIAIKLIV